MHRDDSQMYLGMSLLSTKHKGDIGMDDLSRNPSSTMNQECGAMSISALELIEIELAKLNYQLFYDCKAGIP